jgi:hypothetical protein
METPHRGLDIDKWKPRYINQGMANAQFQLWSTVLRDLSTLFAEIAHSTQMHITTVEARESIEVGSGELSVIVNAFLYLRRTS